MTTTLKKAEFIIKHIGYNKPNIVKFLDDEYENEELINWVLLSGHYLRRIRREMDNFLIDYERECSHNSTPN